MKYNRWNNINGIARMRNKIGDVGRASPAQHPHIFPYIPEIPNEP